MLCSLIITFISTSGTPNIYVSPNYGPNPVSSQWTVYTIPLSALGASSGIIIQ